MKTQCARCERTAKVRVIVKGAASGKVLIDQPLCSIHEAAELRLASFGMAPVEIVPLEVTESEEGAAG